MNALILNDRVVDLSEVPFEVAAPLSWVPCGAEVSIGMGHSMGSFFGLPSITPATPAAPLPCVSPRQIRMALTRKGLRAGVEAAVASGDQDLKDWWEFSTFLDRSHPQVSTMAQALSVTEAQLDDLWALAGTL